MKPTEIFQTLEDRQNDGYVEKHGPFFCALRDSAGQLKRGVKEPWLGEGYYFWDTRIENARWWGNTVYNKQGYLICRTVYDQHSPLLCDLVGDLHMFDEFVKCAKLIKEKKNVEKVSFPVVLNYLKGFTPFVYKAIRVWPFSNNVKEMEVVFPDFRFSLGMLDKVQICFFDKTLLTEPFCIVDKVSSVANQTI